MATCLQNGVKSKACSTILKRFLLKKENCVLYYWECLQGKENYLKRNKFTLSLDSLANLIHFNGCL